LVHRLERRAIEVAMHLGPLEEPAGQAAALELVGVEEQVLAALVFRGAARARGSGHREHAVRTLLEQVRDQRALARARGAGDDEQEAVAGQPGYLGDRLGSGERAHWPSLIRRSAPVRGCARSLPS